MAAASPKTLAEVATLAGIPQAELSLYDAADFDELLKELCIPVTVRVRLKKQHRDLLGGQAHGNAQHKFDAFLSRVGGVDALVGLERVPLATLNGAQIAQGRWDAGHLSRDQGAKPRYHARAAAGNGCQSGALHMVGLLIDQHEPPGGERFPR